MTIRAHGIVLRTTGGEDGPAQAAPTRLEEMPMTFQPLYRPSGRSVWLGKDIVQTDDWIVRLSPATTARSSRRSERCPCQARRTFHSDDTAVGMSLASPPIV